MYISEDYLTSDFDDATFHLKEMLKDALRNIGQHYKHNEGLDFYDMLDTYKVVVDFCKVHSIDTQKLFMDTPKNSSEIHNVLSTFYTNYIMNAGNMYESIFTKKTYTFTDEEHETIQTKINNLRDKILKCKSINEKHKERVLKKLEEMQATLHKKMGTLDTILGAMISIGHTLGLTATEAKPFTDEVKDIMKIVLKTKSRDEHLPENEQLGNTELLKITEF